MTLDLDELDARCLRAETMVVDGHHIAVERGLMRELLVRLRAAEAYLEAFEECEGCGDLDESASDDEDHERRLESLTAAEVAWNTARGK